MRIRRDGEQQKKKDEVSGGYFVKFKNRNVFTLHEEP